MATIEGLESRVCRSVGVKSQEPIEDKNPRAPTARARCRKRLTPASSKLPVGLVAGSMRHADKIYLSGSYNKHRFDVGQLVAGNLSRSTIRLEPSRGGDSARGSELETSSVSGEQRCSGPLSFPCLLLSSNFQQQT